MVSGGRVAQVVVIRFESPEGLSLWFVVGLIRGAVVMI